MNKELVLLYWDIGRAILARQELEGWGAKVIDRLSVDLGVAFPDMKGLSSRNLKYMRLFAEAWPDREIVQQTVALLPWGHQVRLLDKLRDQKALGGWGSPGPAISVGGCWAIREDGAGCRRGAPRVETRGKC